MAIMKIKNIRIKIQNDFTLPLHRLQIAQRARQCQNKLLPFPKYVEELYYVDQLSFSLLLHVHSLIKLINYYIFIYKIIYIKYI